ncbi:MAG: hypothetical protein IKX85_02215, partial [Clostridia bacterium]|nr:hypothetical protein [Clostridia bacterium]
PLLPRSAGVWDGFSAYSFPDDRGKNISAFSFLDDPSAVYLFENEYRSVSAGSGRNVVCTRYGSGDVPLSFRVFDFDAMTVKDTADIPRIFSDGDVSYNDRAVHLQEDCALITAQAFRYSETDGGGDCVELVYLWRFDPEHEEPLALERNTEFALWRKNQLLKDEILKEYEITLHLNEAPPEDYTTWDDSGPGDPVPSVCVTGAPELDIYRLQLTLKGFLETLPAGFTHEMYTDYPGTAANHRSFDIYLVKEIPGSAAAFASGFSREQFLICFAADEFYESHLPHEFMHLIEVRVHAFEESEGRSFWEEWDALNPAEFYYNSDEFDPEYFPTWYAMTDSMEDRADTFMTIYQHALSPGEPDPFADYPHLKAKAELLLASIRAAYPSAAAAEKLFWES